MQSMQSGHVVDLLQGDGSYFDALIEAIDDSRFELWLETYIFHKDATGQRVADALARAASRGVQVRLTVDGVGTPRIDDEWQKSFDHSGVVWRIFLPMGRLGLLIPSRWRRLHRKLCVIDRQVVFCGGINILDDHLDPHHGQLSSPRLDYAVRVTGPLVEEVHESMARFWLRQELARDMRLSEFPAAWRELRDSWRRALGQWGGAGPAPAVPAAPAQAREPGARAVLLLRDNLRNRRRIERSYLQAIGSARSEVIIANAYFLPGARLRRSLVQAARRGVRVRLLLQGRYEYFLQYHASRPVYGALLGAGVEIHEYSASFLHAKVAVVDGTWATVGSSNLDPLSLLLAREANVAVQDSRFAAQLRTSLECAMAEGGRAVDAQAFDRRPWHQRTKELLAYGIMRFALLVLGRRY
jgi:cardiolipin synthase A/B